MPEMVAPRALVFRPLVKGKETPGTRLRPSEYAVLFVLRGAMDFFNTHDPDYHGQLEIQNGSKKALV